MGVLTVELFDKNKNLVHKQEKHNFISQGFYKWLQLVSVNHFLSNAPPELSGSSVESTIDLWENLFERMELTSASHPEEPLVEWFPRGDRTGYALTTGTYSGSDIERGTLNITESFVNSKNARFVFDFSTEKALGTFQSIYFRPSSAFTLTYVPPNEYPGFGFTPRKVKKYNNKYYVLANRDLYIFDEFGVQEAHYPSVTGSSWLIDITVYNNYIYYCHDWASDGIKRAPISDPTNVTTIETGTVFKGIDFDPVSNCFYLTEAAGDYTDGYKVNVHKYNTNFEVLDMKSLNIENSFTSSVLVIADKVMLIGRNYIGDVFGNKFLRNVFSSDIVGADENNLYVGNRKVPKIFIGSRILLNEPVTKTDATTMKITYDLTINSNL